MDCELARIEKQQILLEEDFVYINVSGMMYEILRKTLERFPRTLLGDERRRARYYVKCKGAIFFDRSRECFEAVIGYYQSGGLLIRPPNIPMDVFEDEITFYDLGRDVLARLKRKEGYIFDGYEDIPLPDNPLQRKVWLLFEYPDSSRVARVIALWSILMIALSIVTFCLETVPDAFSAISSSPEHNVTSHHDDADGDREHDSFEGEHREQHHSEHHSEVLEVGCIIWFTLEYVIRLLSSPEKWTFVKSLLNIIDLIAILPYLVIISLRGHSTPYAVVRIVRLVRVFRIFKLSRHYLGLQILGYTLKGSLRDLGMLTVFLGFGLVLFSSGVYYAEIDGSKAHLFPSIPATFWYCLVTMTTVGYGDITPHTIAGKLLGSGAALCGVLALAFVVPVITNSFEHFYKKERFIRKVEKETTKRMYSETTDLPPDEERLTSSPEKPLLLGPVPDLINGGTPKSKKTAERRTVFVTSL